jgi:hypothetical protein
MGMWQWVLLFSAVGLNTIVNCYRLYLEIKRHQFGDDVPKYLKGKKK